MNLLESVDVVICDVDGVLTDGGIYWMEDGAKAFKKFGPDDSSALKAGSVLGFEVILISADRVGFDISKSRAEHMGFPLTLVGEEERHLFISEHSPCLFIGDSYTDIRAAKNARLSGCPADADKHMRESVTYVSSRKGGDRAVAEILAHFAGGYFDV